MNHPSEPGLRLVPPSVTPDPVPRNPIPWGPIMASAGLFALAVLVGYLERKTCIELGNCA
jgi:hypothetical protein